MICFGRINNMYAVYSTLQSSNITPFGEEFQ